MAKSGGKTTGKVAVGGDATTGRVPVKEKSGQKREMQIPRRGEVLSHGAAASHPSPNLRPQTVVVKHDHVVEAASADETYHISMKAAEDVFARFDWTLSELAT